MKMHRDNRQLAVTAGAFAGLGVLVMLLSWWARPFSVPFLHTARSEPFANGERTGTIVLDRGGKCETMVFNNDTGRIVSARGCAVPAPVDGRDRPSAAGTVHRLDAISKSFSKAGGRE